MDRQGYTIKMLAIGTLACHLRPGNPDSKPGGLAWGLLQGEKLQEESK